MEGDSIGRSADLTPTLCEKGQEESDDFVELIKKNDSIERNHNLTPEICGKRQEETDDFFDLIKKNDVLGLEDYLTSHSDFNFNQLNHKNYSALHIAVKDGHEELVEYLLGLDVNLYDVVLHAISLKDYYLTELILQKLHSLNKEFVSYPDSLHFPPYMTPLLCAVHYKTNSIIKLLINRGHTVPQLHKRSCKCNDETCKLLKTSYEFKHYVCQAISYPTYHLMQKSYDPFLACFQFYEYFTSDPECSKDDRYQEWAYTLENIAIYFLNECQTSTEVKELLTKRVGDRVCDIHPYPVLYLAAAINMKSFVCHWKCKEFISKEWCEEIDRSHYSPLTFLYIILMKFLHSPYNMITVCQTKKFATSYIEDRLINIISFIILCCLSWQTFFINPFISFLLLSSNYLLIWPVIKEQLIPTFQIYRSNFGITLHFNCLFVMYFPLITATYETWARFFNTIFPWFILFDIRMILATQIIYFSLFNFLLVYNLYKSSLKDKENQLFEQRRICLEFACPVSKPDIEKVVDDQLVSSIPSFNPLINFNKNMEYSNTSLFTYNLLTYENDIESEIEYRKIIDNFSKRFKKKKLCANYHNKIKFSVHKYLKKKRHRLEEIEC